MLRKSGETTELRMRIAVRPFSHLYRRFRLSVWRKPRLTGGMILEGDGFRAIISHQNPAARISDQISAAMNFSFIFCFNAVVQTSITGLTSHFLLGEKLEILKVYPQMSVPPAAATFHAEFKCFLPSVVSLFFCVIT